MDRSRRRFLGAAVTGLAAAVTGCSAPVGAGGRPSGPGGPSDADGVAEAGSVYTHVYRSAVDAVVLLRAFGDGGSTGQGTAHAWGDGHLVTNEHVVAGADAIEVRYSRGEWRTGEVVGTDVYSDLAAVRVDDPPAYAGPIPRRSAPPVIGAEVVAIGSPFGLEKSLTTGVVSGVNRSIPTEGGFTIAPAIQTDAALNPGNSGGPLVDLDGRVLGTIRSAGGENIGFAIAGGLTERVVPALISAGAYRHPFMGVRLLTVTPTVARANGLAGPTGVLVTEVLDGGPSDGVLRGTSGSATVNGVRVPTGGDVILRLAGRRIAALPALSTVLALETRPGETVEVVVIRDGERRTVDLTLGARPTPG